MSNHINKIVISAIVLFALMYIFGVQSYWRITPDSATYMAGARSIASGHGYKQNGNIISIDPPGTSLFLAPFILLFGENYSILNLAITVLCLLGIPLIFAVFRRHLSVPLSVILMFFCVSSVYFAYSTRFILSEIPYLFFSFLALCYFEYSKKDRRPVLLVLFFSFLPFLFRKIGIVLPLSVSAFLILEYFKNRRREEKHPSLKIPAVILASIAACVAGEFLLRRVFHYEGISSFQLFISRGHWNLELGYYSMPEYIKLFLGNIAVFIKCVVSIFRNWGALPIFFGILAFIFAILGFIGAQRGKNNIYNLYFVLFCFILMLWPSFKNDYMRDMFPIMPFMFYYMLKGFDIFFRYKIKSWIKTLVLAIFCIYIGLYSIMGFKGISGLIRENRAIEKQLGDYHIYYYWNPGVQELARWLSGNSVPDARVAVTHKSVEGMLSDRTAYDFPLSYDESKLLDLLDSRHISYVLIDYKKQQDHLYVIPVIKKYPDKFRKIKEVEGQAALYEVVDFK